jgi:formamidopyrimidine-DNA glycosylase
MPELPEVENLRRGLEQAIVGQKIKRVDVKRPKLVSGKGNIRAVSRKKTHEFTHELVGERINAVERRAKNLIFKLSHEKIILAHLKMSGQFAYQDFKKGAPLVGGHPIELSENELPNKHTHIIFELEKGALYYNDTRMFGYVLYFPDLKHFESLNHFGGLGLEPLSRAFTPKYLESALKNKGGKIKAVLMEQGVVTGLGNIYADECLFEARIRPDRKASSITVREVKMLHHSIIQIIKRAIKMGGSSVSTYRLLDQSRGNYAREHKVYGKSEKPCVKCQKPLQKISLQGRTTVFCSNCQK